MPDPGGGAVSSCRMCRGDDLFLFLDLGSTPPADAFLRKEQLDEPETSFPLQVLMCRTCGLAQLGYTVAPETLYQQDYPYEASTTRAGRTHWTRFARSAVGDLGLAADSLVVDIGSNVGVLLEAFRDSGMRVHGIDPAPNISDIARGRGIDTTCAFFGPDVARQVASSCGRARVITATNVFAHVDDLESFMEGIDVLLDEDGTFILEAPYFGNLLAYTEYDTIYHEHVSYLSVRPLHLFFSRLGMEITAIQQVEIHGGSFRVFVARQGRRPVSADVARLRAQEKETGIHEPAALERFARAVQQNRHDLLWLLRRLKSEGRTIAAVSAPAKGMTLLNYCGIDGSLLEFVTEKSSLKLGKYTPGTHIPVVPDSHLLERQPDYALLLAWNFADEIMRNLDDYRRGGGRFIIPIPTPRVVS